ncbi:MAG: S4 domain-containing protein, partial [Shewanella sp.]
AGSEGIAIANLLKDADLVASTSEALRMIKQGGVKIDGEKVDDAKLTLSAGSTAVYQVGKRKFARVTLK